MSFDTDLNLEPDFDALIEKKMGQYVYVLTDPTNENMPFYVGKGGGSGKGNKRILEHFQEAKEAKSWVPADRHSKKVKTILKIWKAKEEVNWFVYPQLGETDKDSVAEEVEGAIIQFAKLIKPGFLTNKNKGKSVQILSRREVISMAAEKLLLESIPENFLETPIMLFNIKKGYDERKCYEKALVYAWKISFEHRQLKDCLAIGLIDQISHCALQVKEWLPTDIPKRFEINPQKLSTSFWENKNFDIILDQVKGYWGFGSGGGAIIFMVNKNRKLIWLRGKKK